MGQPPPPPHIPTGVLRTAQHIDNLAQHIDNLSSGTEIQGSHCPENTLKCTKKPPKVYHKTPGNVLKDPLKCTKKPQKCTKKTPLNVPKNPPKCTKQPPKMY